MNELLENRPEASGSAEQFTRVCIVSFSSRKEGNCAAIGNYIRELYGGAATLFSFADFSISPCGRCGDECFTKELKCPFIDDMECALIDNIISHDLTYFVVPNYCDYPCSNFFVFGERQRCYFQNRMGALDAYDRTPKKFIAVTNTERENFQKAFSYHVKGEPEILYLSASRYKKNSLAGDVLSSAEAKADVKKFVIGA